MGKKKIIDLEEARALKQSNIDDDRFSEPLTNDEKYQRALRRQNMKTIKPDTKQQEPQDTFSNLRTLDQDEIHEMFKHIPFLQELFSGKRNY